MTSYFDSVASSWDDNPMKIKRATTTAAKVKEVEFVSVNSVVDFGSGTGLLGVQLRDLFTNVHLADSSAKMLEVANSKIESAQLENIQTHQIESLSELDSQYSAIVTLMTLHHIPNILGFFQEANRVLEEGGALIIADLYKEDGSFHKHVPDFDGHNGFDVTELKAIAEQAGFNVEQLEPYFEIVKENEAGEKVAYPLFFLVAKKPV